MSQIKEAQLQNQQEQVRLAGCQEMNKTVVNQGRLGATEVSKYELDKRFKEKQIYNLNWQIENGIEARLKAK